MLVPPPAPLVLSRASVSDLLVPRLETAALLNVEGFHAAKLQEQDRAQMNHFFTARTHDYFIGWG